MSAERLLTTRAVTNGPALCTEAYRTTLLTSPSPHVIKSMNTTFDLFAGGSYKQDQFSTGLIVKSVQALVGDELDYKLNNRAGISERMTFYPNLSRRGEYFVTLDTTATAKLYKWISWQLTFSNRYLTNPVPGTQKNDLLLTTGLRTTFGKAAAF